MRGGLLLVGLGLVAAFAACESSLDLGRGGDAGPVEITDAAAPTCASVCDKVIACGYVALDKRASCMSDCTRGARPSDLECVARAECAAIVSCAPTGTIEQPTDGSAAPNAFEIGTCKESCNQLSFFDCVTAAEHAACHARCEQTTSAARTTFQGCMTGAGSDCERGKDCLGVFDR